MDLLLPMIIISVLVKTCLTSKCAANYTEQGKACMVKVNEQFSLSVPLIINKDKAGCITLCKEYQEFFYCLHDVLDPCEELGAHYFNLLHTEMAPTVGKYCPEAEPNRRRDKTPSSDQFALRSSSERCSYSASSLFCVLLLWRFILIPGT
ncbi:uncharacterized protein LOC135500716 [Lineus longissimus]|uniref:uncharacterized protein LOC135500716 n=1 Tax=Lineus longissimus TaxID=88925 RepID=UPI002B4E44DE